MTIDLRDSSGSFILYSFWSNSCSRGVTWVHSVGNSGPEPWLISWNKTLFQKVCLLLPVRILFLLFRIYNFKWLWSLLLLGNNIFWASSSPPYFFLYRKSVCMCVRVRVCSVYCQFPLDTLRWAVSLTPWLGYQSGSNATLPGSRLGICTDWDTVWPAQVAVI